MNRSKTSAATLSQQQMFLVIIGVVIIAVAILIIVLAAGSPSNATAATVEESQSRYAELTQRITTDGTPVLGNPEAAITLVEFADFSCPHCAEYRHTIHNIVESFVRDGDIRLEMRILTGLDPVGSATAARAAYCANEQDGFWLMYDKLFDLQEQFGRSAFNSTNIRAAAEDLGLDANALDSCMRNTSRYQEEIESTRQLASSLGVNSTPSILLRTNDSRPQWIEINNQRYTNVPQALLETELRSAMAEAAGG